MAESVVGWVAIIKCHPIKMSLWSAKKKTNFIVGDDLQLDHFGHISMTASVTGRMPTQISVC